jgi:choline monooxygenase
MEGPDMLNKVMLERMRGPIDQAACMPGVAYHEPAVLQRERERVFAGRWISIGLGHQAASPGDVRPVSIAGKPLVMVRGMDGKVRVFHNVCRHRGLLLVDQPCHSSSQSLTCPYHGWTYGLDGRCLTIPYWDRSDGKARRPEVGDGFGLLEVPSRIWLDTVFVDLDGTAPPFDEVIAPLASRWAVSAIGRLVKITSWEATAPSNWKLVLENFMDAYHLGFVHPEVGTTKSAADHDVIRISPEVFGLSYLGGAVSRAWAEPLPPIGRLSEVLGSNSESIFLFPNSLFFLHPGFIALRTLLPQSVDTTYVIESVYVSEGGMADRFAAQRAKMVEAHTLISNQDLPILARLQATKRSPASDLGRFVPDWDIRSQLFQVRVMEVLLE